MKLQFNYKDIQCSFEISPSLLWFALNMVIMHGDSIQTFINSLPW